MIDAISILQSLCNRQLKTWMKMTDRTIGSVFNSPDNELLVVFTDDTFCMLYADIDSANMPAIFLKIEEKL